MLVFRYFLTSYPYCGLCFVVLLIFNAHWPEFKLVLQEDQWSPFSSASKHQVFWWIIFLWHLFLGFFFLLFSWDDNLRFKVEPATYIFPTLAFWRPKLFEVILLKREAKSPRESLQMKRGVCFYMGKWDPQILPNDDLGEGSGQAWEERILDIELQPRNLRRDRVHHSIKYPVSLHS